MVGNDASHGSAEQSEGGCRDCLTAETAHEAESQQMISQTHDRTSLLFR